MSKTSKPQSLETYLAQIERELRNLPTSARADEMREIEAHLLTMIAARDDNSTTEALAQFGKPRKVGRDLRRAWERKQPEAWWRALLAPVAGLAFNIFTGFVGLFLLLPQTSLSGLGDTTWRIVFISCTIFLFVVMQLFYTGVIVGSLSPKRGKQAVLIIAILLVVFSLLFPNVVDKSNFMDVAMLLGGTMFEFIPIFIGVHVGAQRERQRGKFARFVGLE